MEKNNKIKYCTKISSSHLIIKAVPMFSALSAAASFCHDSCTFVIWSCLRWSCTWSLGIFLVLACSDNFTQQKIQLGLGQTHCANPTQDFVKLGWFSMVFKCYRNLTVDDEPQPIYLCLFACCLSKISLNLLLIPIDSYYSCDLSG